MHSRVLDDIIHCNNGDVTMCALDALEAVNDKGGQGDPYFKNLEISKCYQAIGSFLSDVVSVGYSTFSGIMLIICDPADPVT